MLDKIQNNNAESVIQSQSLDRIKSIGVSNPFEEDDNAFFIDESRISSAALEKYQREVDIKKFSEIFNQIDEKAAIEEVIKQAFDGGLSIDDDDFLLELMNDKDFLNDIA